MRLISVWTRIPGSVQGSIRYIKGIISIDVIRNILEKRIRFALGNYTELMDIVVSGIRSTGNLHLGNYFGAIRNFLKMQKENKCFFFIADYHSLTTHPKPDHLHDNIKQVLAEYLACGIDPEIATVFIQSDVPEVIELYLLLNMNAYVGELERRSFNISGTDGC